MLPPLGSLIVGPCPECMELVVVFGGHVLPLNKELMINGSAEERKDHLMDVLTSFLDERVNQLLIEAEKEELEQNEEEQEDALSFANSEDEADSNLAEMNERAQRASSNTQAKVISRIEFENFVHVDLNLLDNKDYFRAVFG